MTEVCYLRVKFIISRTTKIKIKMKNRTFAIPAETEAIFPKPSTAAIMAIIKNTTAQANSPMVKILYLMIDNPLGAKCPKLFLQDRNHHGCCFAIDKETNSNF